MFAGRIIKEERGVSRKSNLYRSAILRPRRGRRNFFPILAEVRSSENLGEPALRPISDLNFDELRVREPVGICDSPCWLSSRIPLDHSRGSTV